MTYKDKLYNLLPEYYRIKDVEAGRPLESLLKIIAEQADILEENISELYENWFIETCKQWVVPYIGDLVAARNLNHDITTGSTPRSWVCDTMGYRRRKGTHVMLEELAHDVTGWNAKAVEFFKVLSSTQNINNLHKVTTVNMRDPARLSMHDTPFDTNSHNLDVRHINNNRGKYNVSNLGFFMWRLQSYSVEDSPAFDYGNGKFTFDSLGRDTLLFNSPQAKFSPIEDETGVPQPIQRFGLKNNLARYYGDGKAIYIQADGYPVSSEKIVVANLTDWKNRPSDGKVAVDPVLGRILFSPGKTPKKVYASYHFGFSSDIGSRYSKRAPDQDNITVYFIAKNEAVRKTLPSSKTFATLNDAIKNWNTLKDLHAIYEFVDSEVYEESIDEIQIPADAKIEIRAEEGKRPVLKLTKSLSIVGPNKNSYQDSSVILDGLTIDRKGSVPTLIEIKKGNLDLFSISYCTMVPSKDSQMNSLTINEGNDLLTITIDKSICGRIVTKSEAGIKISDSIVDGAEDAAAGSAISCYSMTIRNCTVFGGVEAKRIDLARNTIFNDIINVKFRQKGVMQFCYLPFISSVPRRFRCQPNETASPFATRPMFTSEKFGDPCYAQLDIDTDKSILEGADDENEIGAFNYLHQAMRINNLKVTLDEYMPFGLEGGIFMVT